LRTLDEEGTGFGIAAHHATDAFLIGAAGVDGGGVNGVAGIDGEDWLIEGRELAVEDSGGEVVALGRGVLERRRKDGGEGVVFRVRRIADVYFGVIACEGAVLERSLYGVRAAFVVFGDEVDLIAGDCAFEFVAVEVAGELVALLVEGEASVDGSAEDVGSNDPVAGERPVLGGCCKCGEREERGGCDADHEASPDERSGGGR
jgi:hypothetical protein